MATEPSVDDIVELFSELEYENIERNKRDAELENIYLNSEFTGKLSEAITDQIPRSSERKLLLNVVRNAIQDRAVLLKMLPDLRVDAPDGLPEMDSLYWQQHIERIIKHYFWEEIWNLPNVQMRSQAFWLAMKGRVALQVHPNFAKKTVDLLVRDPSTFYCTISGSGQGWHMAQGSMTQAQGGYQLSQGGFKYKAKGRDILAMYPTSEKIGIEPNNTSHDVIEYQDENFFIPVIDNQLILKEDGDPVGVEHGLGFVPLILIQDVHIPGRIDATSPIYHSIMMGENLNDLLLMDTEERRERLGSITVVENPVNVPKNLAVGRNAIIQVGLGGDVRFRSRLGDQNPSDMGSHIEAMKQMWSMAAKTSLARQGELPSSGPWLGKGLQTAATVAISGDVLDARENIAQGIQNADTMALAMGIKYFPSSKQKMTVHSSRGNQPMTFTFKSLKELTIRHILEVFPLAHDIPSTVVTYLQLQNGGIVSKRKVRQMIPGIDEAEETRRVDEERQKEMMEAMAIQQAQAQQQAEAQGGQPGGGEPGDVEKENVGLERGAVG